jgi:hypothetical protein
MQLLAPPTHTDPGSTPPARPCTVPVREWQPPLHHLVLPPAPLHPTVERTGAAKCRWNTAVYLTRKRVGWLPALGTTARTRGYNNVSAYHHQLSWKLAMRLYKIGLGSHAQCVSFQPNAQLV